MATSERLRNAGLTFAHVLNSQGAARYSFPQRGENHPCVQNNLSTHKAASLYAGFPALEPRRLVERYEWQLPPSTAVSSTSRRSNWPRRRRSVCTAASPHPIGLTSKNPSGPLRELAGIHGPRHQGQLMRPLHPQHRCPIATSFPNSNARALTVAQTKNRSSR